MDAPGVFTRHEVGVVSDFEKWSKRPNESRPEPLVAALAMIAGWVREDFGPGSTKQFSSIDLGQRLQLCQQCCSNVDRYLAPWSHKLPLFVSAKKIAYENAATLVTRNERLQIQKESIILLLAGVDTSANYTTESFGIVDESTTVDQFVQTYLLIGLNNLRTELKIQPLSGIGMPVHGFDAKEVSRNLMSFFKFKMPAPRKGWADTLHRNKYAIAFALVTLAVTAAGVTHDWRSYKNIENLGVPLKNENEHSELLHKQIDVTRKKHTVNGCVCKPVSYWGANKHSLEFAGCGPSYESRQWCDVEPECKNRTVAKKGWDYCVLSDYSSDKSKNIVIDNNVFVCAGATNFTPTPEAKNLSRALSALLRARSDFASFTSTSRLPTVSPKYLTTMCVGDGAAQSNYDIQFDLGFLNFDSKGATPRMLYETIRPEMFEFAMTAPMNVLFLHSPSVALQSFYDMYPGLLFTSSLRRRLVESDTAGTVGVALSFLAQEYMRDNSSISRATVMGFSVNTLWDFCAVDLLHAIPEWPDANSRGERAEKELHNLTDEILRKLETRTIARDAFTDTKFMSKYRTLVGQLRTECEMLLNVDSVELQFLLWQAHLGGLQDVAYELDKRRVASAQHFALNVNPWMSWQWIDFMWQKMGSEEAAMQAFIGFFDNPEEPMRRRHVLGLPKDATDEQCAAEETRLRIRKIDVVQTIAEIKRRALLTHNAAAVEAIKKTKDRLLLKAQTHRAGAGPTFLPTGFYTPHQYSGITKQIFSALLNFFAPITADADTNNLQHFIYHDMVGRDEEEGNIYGFFGWVKSMLSTVTQPISATVWNWTLNKHRDVLLKILASNISKSLDPGARRELLGLDENATEAECEAVEERMKKERAWSKCERMVDTDSVLDGTNYKFEQTDLINYTFEQTDCFWKQQIKQAPQSRLDEQSIEELFECDAIRKNINAILQNQKIIDAQLFAVGISNSDLYDNPNLYIEAFSQALNILGVQTALPSIAASVILTTQLYFSAGTGKEALALFGVKPRHRPADPVFNDNLYTPDVSNLMSQNFGKMILPSDFESRQKLTSLAWSVLWPADKQRRDLLYTKYLGAVVGVVSGDYVWETETTMRASSDCAVELEPDWNPQLTIINNKFAEYKFADGSLSYKRTFANKGGFLVKFWEGRSRKGVEISTLYRARLTALEPYLSDKDSFLVREMHEGLAACNFMTALEITGDQGHDYNPVSPTWKKLMAGTSNFNNGQIIPFVGLGSNKVFDLIPSLRCIERILYLIETSPTETGPLFALSDLIFFEKSVHSEKYTAVGELCRLRTRSKPGKNELFELEVTDAAGEGILATASPPQTLSENSTLHAIHSGVFQTSVFPFESTVDIANAVFGPESVYDRARIQKKLDSIISETTDQTFFFPINEAEQDDSKKQLFLAVFENQFPSVVHLQKSAGQTAKKDKCTGRMLINLFGYPYLRAVSAFFAKIQPGTARIELTVSQAAKIFELFTSHHCLHELTRLRTEGPMDTYTARSGQQQTDARPPNVRPNKRVIGPQISRLSGILTPNDLTKADQKFLGLLSEFQSMRPFDGRDYSQQISEGIFTQRLAIDIEVLQNIDRTIDEKDVDKLGKAALRLRREFLRWFRYLLETEYGKTEWAKTMRDNKSWPEDKITLALIAFSQFSSANASRMEMLNTVVVPATLPPVERIMPAGFSENFMDTMLVQSTGQQLVNTRMQKYVRNTVHTLLCPATVSIHQDVVVETKVDVPIVASHWNTDGWRTTTDTKIFVRHTPALDIIRIVPVKKNQTITDRFTDTVYRVQQHGAPTLEKVLISVLAEEFTAQPTAKSLGNSARKMTEVLTQAAAAIIQRKTLPNFYGVTVDEGRGKTLLSQAKERLQTLRTLDKFMYAASENRPDDFKICSAFVDTKYMQHYPSNPRLNAMNELYRELERHPDRIGHLMLPFALVLISKPLDFFQSVGIQAEKNKPVHRGDYKLVGIGDDKTADTDANQTTLRELATILSSSKSISDANHRLFTQPVEGHKCFWDSLSFEYEVVEAEANSQNQNPQHVSVYKKLPFVSPLLLEKIAFAVRTTFARIFAENCLKTRLYSYMSSMLPSSTRDTLADLDMQFVRVIRQVATRATVSQIVMIQDTFLQFVTSLRVQFPRAFEDLLAPASAAKATMMLLPNNIRTEDLIESHLLWAQGETVCIGQGAIVNRLTNGPEKSVSYETLQIDIEAALGKIMDIDTEFNFADVALLRGQYKGTEVRVSCASLSKAYLFSVAEAHIGAVAKALVECEDKIKSAPLGSTQCSVMPKTSPATDIIGMSPSEQWSNMSAAKLWHTEDFTPSLNWCRSVDDDDFQWQKSYMGFLYNERPENNNATRKKCGYWNNNPVRCDSPKASQKLGPICLTISDLKEFYPHEFHESSNSLRIESTRWGVYSTTALQNVFVPLKILLVGVALFDSTKSKFQFYCTTPEAFVMVILSKFSASLSAWLLLNQIMTRYFESGLVYRQYDRRAGFEINAGVSAGFEKRALTNLNPAEDEFLRGGESEGLSLDRKSLMLLRSGFLGITEFPTKHVPKIITELRKHLRDIFAAVRWMSQKLGVELYSTVELTRQVTRAEMIKKVNANSVLRDILTSKGATVAIKASILTFEQFVYDALPQRKMVLRALQTLCLTTQMLCNQIVYRLGTTQDIVGVLHLDEGDTGSLVDKKLKFVENSIDALGGIFDNSVVKTNSVLFQYFAEMGVNPLWKIQYNNDGRVSYVDPGEDIKKAESQEIGEDSKKAESQEIGEDNKKAESQELGGAKDRAWKQNGLLIGPQNMA